MKLNCKRQYLHFFTQYEYFVCDRSDGRIADILLELHPNWIAFLRNRENYKKTNLGYNCH